MELSPLKFKFPGFIIKKAQFLYSFLSYKFYDFFHVNDRNIHWAFLCTTENSIFSAAIKRYKSGKMN